MLGIQSPLIDEIVTKARCEAARKCILGFLAGRFGAAPEDVAAALQTIEDESRLDELVCWTARCPDLDAFRARLLS